MKKWLPMLVLVFLCLPVVWALFKPGFYITHDGEFNLVRLMHFYDELTKGQFPVRWSSDLDYRYGSPLFTFFYPLTYYLGSLIHLAGPDFSSSLKILIGVTTVGSVLVMYLFLKKHYRTWPALVGALLYLFVPYRLVTMYVTGSFGVLLSLFFLPLILLAIDRKSVFWIALGTAGLLMSHNVTALILLPVALGYALIHFKPRLVLGFLLGLGLAASFILPAFLETKYTYLSQGIAVPYQDHFPTLRELVYSPWGYGYSEPGPNDGMSFQVGLAQWLAASAALLFLIKEKKRDNIFFLFVFGAALFMMLPVSLGIWKTEPMLPQIQFPWRILAATMVVIPFLAAYCVSRKKIGPILGVIFIAVMIINNRNYLRTWETIRYSDASYKAREGYYYGSTDIAWETRPIWVKEKPVWLAAALKDEITATAAGEMTLDRFYYPTQSVYVDGVKTAAKPTEKTGLIRFYLTAGTHKFELKTERTDLEKLADGVSIISILCLTGLYLKRFA